MTRSCGITSIGTGKRSTPGVDAAAGWPRPSREAGLRRVPSTWRARTQTTARSRSRGFMEQKGGQRSGLQHRPGQHRLQLRRVFGQRLGDHVRITCAPPAPEQRSGSVHQANVALLVGNVQAGIDFAQGSSSFLKRPNGYRTWADFVVGGRVT